MQIISNGSKRWQVNNGREENANRINVFWLDNTIEDIKENMK